MGGSPSPCPGRPLAFVIKMARVSTSGFGQDVRGNTIPVSDGCLLCSMPVLLPQVPWPFSSHEDLLS